MADTYTSIHDIPLIPRKDIFGAAQYINVQISPDGHYLSWIASLNGIKNIWVCPIHDLNKAAPVTHDSQQGIFRYQWSFLANTLIYFKDEGGSESFHIFAVDIISGDIRDLMPGTNASGKLFGLKNKNPQTIVIGLNDRDPTWFDVYEVDLLSGQRTLLEENKNNFFKYDIGPDNQLIFGKKKCPDGSTTWFLKENSTWREAFTVPFEDDLCTNTVGFSSDSSTAYIQDPRGRNTSAIIAFDIASGQKKTIYADDEADINNWILSLETGEVLAVRLNYLRRKWIALSDELRPDIDYLNSQFTEGFRIWSKSNDLKTWIVSSIKATDPANYYLYQSASRQLVHLFSSLPNLKDAPLVPMWPVEIASRDDLVLPSYLSLPAHSDPQGKGRPISPQPLLILVHGGPWMRYDYGFHAGVQWLTNRGYAVLQVNYRGSFGFGKKFLNAANHEWGGRMHDDLIDAVDWAIDQNITTRDQVGIFGGSYGGYATLVGMTFTPDRFVCGVEAVGPSNLVTFIESIPEFWKDNKELWYTHVGDPRTEEGRKFLWSRSPLSRVNDIKNPLMIFHGANDSRVPQSESEQIVEAMKKKGLPVVYALFPDEGHFINRSENQKAYMATIEAFLSKFLGGRAEPLGDDLEGSSIEFKEGIEDIPGLAEVLKSHGQEIKN